MPYSSITKGGELLKEIRSNSRCYKGSAATTACLTTEQGTEWPQEMKVRQSTYGSAICGLASMQGNMHTAERHTVRMANKARQLEAEQQWRPCTWYVNSGKQHRSRWTRIWNLNFTEIWLQSLLHPPIDSLIISRADTIPAMCSPFLPGFLLPSWKPG